MIKKVKLTKSVSRSVNLLAAINCQINQGCSTFNSHLFSRAEQCSTVQDFHYLSNKRRNNLIKQTNGNGKNSLSVCHWNLGSKKWKNKRNQIQALVDHLSPDIIYISEANLDEVTPPHESIFITGYKITFPKTVTRNRTARLVLLTRDNLNFELMDNLMDDVFTSIWIKISRPGVKGLLGLWACIGSTNT